MPDEYAQSKRGIRTNMPRPVPTCAFKWPWSKRRRTLQGLLPRIQARCGHRCRNRSITMVELPEDIHNKIERLCATGDAQAKQQQFAQALTSYWAAWDLLPEPKVEWEAATWILAAVGDANFLGGDYV